MSDKKTHTIAGKAVRYLKGELHGEERYHFEREMESDPFLMEAMEGLERLTTAEAEQDLLALHDRLRKRLARRRRIAIYSAAATVASILIVGTIFFQIRDLNPPSADEVITRKEIKEALPEAVQAVPEMGETSPEAVQAADQVETIDRVRDLGQEMAVSETGADREPAATPAAGKAPAGTANGAAKKAAADAEGAMAPAETERVMAPAEPDEGKSTVAREIVVMEAEPRQEVSFAMEAEEAAPGEPALADEQVAAVEPMAVAEPVSREKATAPRAKRSRRAKSEMFQSEMAQPAERTVVPLPEGTISGRVVAAEEMEPLHGALVLVKEGDTGVITDRQGNFTIPAEQDATRTLVTSFVGMETGEFRVTEGVKQDLVMQPDLTRRDEVVLVAHGDGSTFGAKGKQPVAYHPTGLREKGYTSARPSVGYPAYTNYIRENMRFPEADTAVERTEVVLAFTVTPGGEILNVIPLRTPGEPFTREAVRLVKEGPPWLPASNSSGNINETVQVRIVFKQ